MLAGLGLAARHLFGLTNPASTDDIHVAPWVGFALTILFLQIWHLAFPVDYRALLVLAPCAVLGFWLSRGSLTNWLAFARWRGRLWSVPVYIALAVWVSNWSMG